MKITIRPAPHSKGCAVDGRSSCDLYQNHQEKCAEKCTTDMCCEMKHCWELGEELQRILQKRGHQVKMADKKYRKGWPDSKATQHTKDAMKELMAWAPDLHIAIHTNAAGASVQGVRIGCPDIVNNKGETQRVSESERLAELMVEANKAVYHSPAKVLKTSYNYYEVNAPTCPAVYIEACFANTNKADAEWLHGNMGAIAAAYADAIDKWCGKTTEEAEFVSYKATVKTKTGSGASIWSDNKKTKRIEMLPDGTVVDVLGGYDAKGFAPVDHNGNRGVFDSQYLVRVEEKPETENDVVDALIEALKNIRQLADDAINKVGGA